MSLFTWSSAYSINNEELDRHHEMLFEIFNKLYDSSENPTASATLHTIVAELDDYSKYHFRAEEQYLRDIGYHDIASQMLSHNYFTARLIDLKVGRAHGTADTFRELILFLGNWLIHHILEEDKQITTSQHHNTGARHRKDQQCH